MLWVLCAVRCGCVVGGVVVGGIGWGGDVWVASVRLLVV